MYNILCIASILLLGSFLHALSPLVKQPISVITEVPQNTFVNDTVNVITGGFYLQMPHMSVPGHVPLDLIQYYHSQSTFTSWFGTGMSLNYGFWMQGQGKDDRWSKLFAELPGGSIISCLGKNRPNGTGHFYLDPEVLKENFTNCGSSQISARTNLKNVQIVERVKNNAYADWTLYLPDGTIRSYHRAFSKEDMMNVHTEKRPNNTHLHFSYHKYHEEEGCIRKITAGAKHPLNWLAFDGSLKHHKARVVSSNGKKVRFSAFKMDDKYYIDEIESTENPKATFHYTHAGEYYCIDRIDRPDGRYLELEYDHKGRVKNQKAPVGYKGEKRTLYAFTYHKDATEVIDGHDQKKVYNHKHGRTTSIDHFVAKKLYRSQTFYWGNKQGFSWGERPDTEEGNLLGYAVCGKDEQGAFLCHYKYDTHGNIVKETLYGNLSGKGISHFAIASDSHPKRDDIESYHKYYEYSKDHLLTREHEDSGLAYEYHYKRGSDLVEAKFTCDGKKILLREFFCYDDDGILIEKIVDDGSSHTRSELFGVTERHITKIRPVQNKEGYGQGLPQEVAEYYLSSGKQVLLNRIYYNYNKASQIIEEAIFDATNTYRYSIHYDYDKKGRLIKKTNPLGEVFRYGYDKNNNKTYEKQEDTGFYTTYEYDTANRCIAIIQHHNDGEKVGNYSSYDLMGNKSSSTNRYGHTTSHEYDHANRLSKITFPNQTSLKKEYDIFDNVTKEINQNDKATSYEYTIRQKPSLITYADGTNKRFFYNKEGTLAHEWDQSGTKTSYTYDILGRIIETSVYDASGTLLSTSKNTYNSFHLLSSTNPLGHTTFYRYDGAGRKIEEWQESPEWKVTGANYSKITISYDSLGRLSSTKNFYGKEIAESLATYREYDNLDRLILEKQVDANEACIGWTYHEYDAQGNIILTRSGHTAEDAEVQHLFNSQGECIAFTDEYGFTTRSTYNHHFVNNEKQTILQKSTTDPKNIQTEEYYDILGRCISTLRKNSQGILLAITDYLYNNRNKKIEQVDKVIVDGVIERDSVLTWEYDALDRVVTHTEQPGTSDDGFDAVGNLLHYQFTDKLGSVDVYASYNDLSQLVEEKGVANHSYKLDSLHNRLVKNDQEHHIDAANKVLSDGASSFTYDKNGNLIHQQSAQGSTSYTYDALDRLTQVTDGETTTRYLYDCFNRRLARIHNDGTEYFLYQDMREIGSLKNGQIEEFRVLGLGKGAELGASIALELKGQVFAPIHDFRGNIVSLVDTEGTIQESYRYTAFGECEAHCQSSPLSPWRFASKRYDPETGFVYFARRYYAPELGRWITPDPLGIADGPNRYAYVHHNPLTRFDLYGLYGFEDEYDPIEAMVIYGMLEASVRNTVDFAGFVGSFVHSGAESYARSCNEAIDSYRDALANQMASLPGTEVSANELRDAATAGVHLRNAVDLTRAAKTITTQAIRKGQSLLRAAEKGAPQTVAPLSKEFIKEGIATEKYVPICPVIKEPLSLPRSPCGVDLPSSNSPHTQIGWRKSKRNKPPYRQTREWGHNGKETKTTDWTDHEDPIIHTNPHDHLCIPNTTGGTLKRDTARPFTITDEKTIRETL